ncbi:SctK family type III secretion system sorting platform protein [Variovorax sp. ZS18.2.2]|uniref:SctK family type III secretion system sorting platform protein n=1 Tax=Variovorax sp. ZS18.2.2 TaxID=2971255 RepID=UPI002151D319|nr:SctK family type III secretion system sorting platform protein [Variovorax sp. ZS18.2.2]MCR6475843.1 SctK family type III secretion system sorting platform protein [Variovorax sp. ZS18.2.2]
MQAPATAPIPPAAMPGPMDLVRLVMRFNLHPEADLHPSWLPANWPVRHRSVARMGPAGRAVLAVLLRREQAKGSVQPQAAADYNFDSRLKRLALLDAASLRRLAAYLGFCAHLPLFKVRGGAGLQIRRQARRFDSDAVDFVLDRVPQLTELRMDSAVVQQRPIATGRVVLDRGYRLLLGAAASEGELVLQRLKHKLPRRISALSVPVFEPRQALQLNELMLSCIVPERLPQWDWLF